MAEGVDIKFFDREFNAAIDQIADTSLRTDIEVLTGQARRLLLALVRRTRFATEKRGKEVRFRNRGRARAGWWHSWAGLGMFSIPLGTDPRVLMRAEGSFKDGRGRGSQPFVEMTNEVNYIQKLDKQDNILANSVAERFADMQREITRRYKQTLRRHSGI